MCIKCIYRSNTLMKKTTICKKLYFNIQYIFINILKTTGLIDLLTARNWFDHLMRLPQIEKGLKTIPFYPFL